MINISKDQDILWIEINEDWNWVVSQKIEQVSMDASKLIINLNKCRLMDSESLILIWKWLDSDKEIELLNVPDIYFEMIKILSLEDHFKSIKIST